MNWEEKFLGKVICGNCFELMKEIPNKSIDLVLTDTPYGIGLKYDIYNDSDENWTDLFSKLIPEIKRISTMSILPCCQIKKLQYIYQKFPPDWIICWYKGSPGTNAFIGFNDWEPLLVYGKNKGVQMHDYFYCQPEISQNINHPCPKPVQWAKWIIRKTTKENDIVLDPFLGSGTTAVACKQLDRRWIGIEISEEYCEIARKRIAEAKRQEELFG